MQKKIGLSAVFFLLSFCAVAFVYADNSETLTISTYFPSPYGSYNQVQVNKLAVGDTNNNGQLDTGDQPSNNGDIRLKTHAAAPPAESGVVGEIAYGSDSYLYVHNGSTWVKQGGGGCINTYCSCRWVSSGSGSCTCTPPSCPTGFTDEGTNGIIETSYFNSNNGLNGGTQGDSRFCCK